MKTLYVSRQLTNAKELMYWARSQGFKRTLDENDFHVTIAYSKKEVDWDQIELRTDKIEITGGKRTVEPLGDMGAVVLKFKSVSLPERWQEFIDIGASWDFESYVPHVTITYKGTDLDPSKVDPYDGVLAFGPEKIEELEENWSVDKE